MARPRKRPAPGPDAPREGAEAATNRQRTTQERAGPVRTPQNVFEAAEGETTTYNVEAIKGVQWVKGCRQYLVAWEGYGEKDMTWEPMENLVGCAQQIREYEKEREKHDALEKERVLKKRKEAKERAAEEDGQGGEGAQQAKGVEGDPIHPNAELNEHEGKVLKIHLGKTGTVWSQFDLTKIKRKYMQLIAPGVTLRSSSGSREASLVVGSFIASSQPSS
ncbi:hypothetical protein AB1Y20_005101 [Prymnesium parvum]|uniref:Chromo domain-containing protein n=1 Tax=Prymnesium parvum TaxID=97485 RepID=A0AB34J4W5_PRYPA